MGVTYRLGTKTKTPDEIRVCVDMREANKAIIRERHMMLTLDELIRTYP